jgi:hypothetical protein
MRADALIYPREIDFKALGKLAETIAPQHKENSFK